MTEENFQEIINFAIAREDEAATFYHDLQKHTKLDSSKIILHELEMMEKGHAAILRNFKNEGLESYQPPKITNLKISEYMMETPIHQEMTYQEILIVAIKREENAYNLYNSLAAETENEKTKNLLLKIAHEEAKHKLQLETIYDQEILVEN